MNDGISTATTTESAASRGLSRSPVLTEIRLNLFRVLRLPINAGVDEAIWKAEELLTLLRAGIDDPESALLPWLPPPGEPEIRQAVQAAEEPLRRLIARLSWFDFQDDPAGELLRKAVTSLAPADVDAYFNAPVELWDDATTPVVRELNQANLSMMLAAKAFTTTRKQSEVPTWEWQDFQGTPIVMNPHSKAAGGGDSEAAAALWQRGINRWVTLLNDPKFQDFLRNCLAALGDDLVGADDAESVVNTLWTRLTDLLAGEVKSHLQEGQAQRAAVLLKVAAETTVETRRWVLALRSLRPKFKAELGELDVLLSAPTPRFADIRHYLDRVHAQARAWSAFDPGNLLMLGELTDEAVGKAIGVLSASQDYATLNRVTELLERAKEAAVADSVKSKAASTIGQLEGLKDYACHFCEERDMDFPCSAIINGQKETGRTFNGSSTTIYYATRKGFVPRCECCADLHEYLRYVGIWTWVALLPLALLLAIWRFDVTETGPYGRQEGPPIILIFALIAGAYVASGFVVRWIVSSYIKPKQHRSYSDVSGTKHYREMSREGFTITLDYSRNAYKTAVGSR